MLGLDRVEGTCEGDGKEAALMVGGKPAEVGCHRGKEVEGCQFSRNFKEGSQDENTNYLAR